MSDAQLFSGRIAVVTGASSGIGLAVAQQLARAGATVALAGRDPARGKAALATLRSDAATFVATDVTQAGAVERVIDGTASKHGRLDILIQAAGLTGPRVTLADYPRTAWDKVIAVNLTGPHLMMQGAFRIMAKQRSGAIVNVASIAGLAGAPARPAYVASKHGLIGLTRAAALEGAALGIRVNAVCPGGTDTPMMRAWLGDDAAALAARGATTPMGRLATADEIAAMIVWLCSDAASYVNGAIIPVDGGTMAMVPARPPAKV